MRSIRAMAFCRKVKDVDLVVSTSPQFFCAIGGWALSVAKWRPFVFELRDLWPASIVAVGAMGKSPAIRMLEHIELFLYRRAAAIVSVTESFREDLVARGIPREKIHVGDLPLECCLTGAVSRDEWHARLDANGFEPRLWEDHSKALKEFAARLIFSHGSMDEFWRRFGSRERKDDAKAIQHAVSKARPGYFLLIARK